MPDDQPGHEVRISQPPVSRATDPASVRHEARIAGGRLLLLGGALLVVGLIVVVLSDRETGGSVLRPETAREGRGISLLAGLPATIGYVLGAVGLYRLVTGQPPDTPPRSTPWKIARALFAGIVVSVFFVGAFVIVLRLRG
jgi:hypothetical protein